MISLERKSVRVSRDDLSREEECKGSQEIIPLERKSVRVPRYDDADEQKSDEYLIEPEGANPAHERLRRQDPRLLAAPMAAGLSRASFSLATPSLPS